MIWKVDTEQGQILLDPNQLISVLLSKTDIPDQHRFISNTGVEVLSKSIVSMSPREIITLGFHLGYTYKTFLEKNKVTIQNDDANISGSKN